MKTIEIFDKDRKISDTITGTVKVKLGNELKFDQLCLLATDFDGYEKQFINHIESLGFDCIELHGESWGGTIKYLVQFNDEEEFNLFNLLFKKADFNFIFG